MKVPIKRWVDDPALPIHSRFKALVDHHKEETEWLISELERIRDGVAGMIARRNEGLDDFTDADALAGINDMLSSTPPRIPSRSVSPDVEFARKVLSGPALLAARNVVPSVPDEHVESIIRVAMAEALEDVPLDVPELMGGRLPMEDESPDAHAWRLACGTAQAGYERKCKELEELRTKLERQKLVDLFSARKQQLVVARVPSQVAPRAVASKPANQPVDSCPISEITLKEWEYRRYDQTSQALAWLIRREKLRNGLK